MLFLLDQEATEKLIMQDAKSMGIATEPPDEKMFQAYIDRVTKGVTVPETPPRLFMTRTKIWLAECPLIR
jgi:hypothetical protein